MNQLRYFEIIKDIMRKRKVNTIVEIGSIRNEYGAEGDGHSTKHWAEIGEVYSYDINPDAIKLTTRLVNSDRLHAEVKDGIQALKEFKKPIDFLYLDGWDAIPGTDYQEKHLEAFKEAEKNLHSHSLVLIDDMEIEEGKGKLILPYAAEKGWKYERIGKQMLLYKGEI